MVWASAGVACRVVRVCVLFLKLLGLFYVVSFLYTALPRGGYDVGYVLCAKHRGFLSALFVGVSTKTARRSLCLGV